MNVDGPEKYYSVCLSGGRNSAPGLIFSSVDTERLSNDPAIAELFPEGYFVKAVSSGRYFRWRRDDLKKSPLVHTLVTTVLDEYEPDKAAFDSPPVTFFYKGVKYAVNPRQRYNECLSLFKAPGCIHCPDRGVPCLFAGARIDTLPELVQGKHHEEFYEIVSKRKPVISDHTFVAPTLARLKEFASKFRIYYEFDFSAVKKTQETLSKRAQDGAMTRKFKKTQCAKCTIRTACSRAAHCNGPLPPEEEIIQSCNQKLDELIQKSKMPYWQIDQLVRNFAHKAKHSRWNLVLLGVHIYNGELVPNIYRAKSSIERFPYLETYDRIANVFGLAPTEDKAHVRELKPLTRALWWLGLDALRGRYRWRSNREFIGVGLGIPDHYVEIQWTKPGYLSHSNSVSSFATLSEYISYGGLPGIQHLNVTGTSP